jgi:hypothetical protein
VDYVEARKESSKPGNISGTVNYSIWQLHVKLPVTLLATLDRMLNKEVFPRYFL